MCLKGCHSQTPRPPGGLLDLLWLQDHLPAPPHRAPQPRGGDRPPGFRRRRRRPDLRKNLAEGAPPAPPPPRPPALPQLFPLVVCFVSSSFLEGGEAKTWVCCGGGCFSLFLFHHDLLDGRLFSLEGAPVPRFVGRCSRERPKDGFPLGCHPPPPPSTMEPALGVLKDQSLKRARALVGLVPWCRILLEKKDACSE